MIASANTLDGDFDDRVAPIMDGGIEEGTAVNAIMDVDKAFSITAQNVTFIASRCGRDLAVHFVIRFAAGIVGNRV